MIPDHLAGRATCRLTTTGRRSGRRHTIEIWFAADGDSVYVLSGGGDRSDWVRNLRADPEVTVGIAGVELSGQARMITDPAEERRARDLVHDKYASGYGGDLSRWREASLPVAVDVVGGL